MFFLRLTQFRNNSVLPDSSNIWRSFLLPATRRCEQRRQSSIFVSITVGSVGSWTISPHGDLMETRCNWDTIASLFNRSIITVIYIYRYISLYIITIIDDICVSSQISLMSIFLLNILN